MQVEKGFIRKSILDTAEKMFLKRGYADVSMREISSKAEVGLSNMYNYFKNKDELFRTLAQPAVSAMDKLLDEHHGRDGRDWMELDPEEALRSSLHEYLLVLKKYRKETTLLLFCARGSSLQNFKDDFVRKTTPLVREYLNVQQQRLHKGKEVEVSDFFIDLHTVWMFTLLQELLKKKVSDKDMDSILNEYIKFETTGWRELIEL